MNTTNYSGILAYSQELKQDLNKRLYLKIKHIYDNFRRRDHVPHGCDRQPIGKLSKATQKV
jgi:hypothetical protein